jgi:L-gulonolactone oxidase
MSGDTAQRAGAAALPWRNWDGNQRAVASAVLTPAGVDDVIALVKDAGATGHTVKAVGSGHSFTAIARTDDRRVELHRMTGLVAVDRAAKTVTVQSGMPLRVLNATLAELGLALANLGDITAPAPATPPWPPWSPRSRWSTAPARSAGSTRRRRCSRRPGSAWARWASSPS